MMYHFYLYIIRQLGAMRHGMVRNTKKENTYQIVSSKGVELGFKGVS